MIDHPESEIGGKAFIEPEVSPVGRGDQVTEPLVGNFMSDDLAYSFFTEFRGNFRIMKQQIFTECDGTPVFHGTKGEIRDCNEIHFGQGIGDGVIGLAESKGLAAEFSAKLRIFFHAGKRDDPNPAVFFILGKLKFAHPEKNKVGRHSRGLLECDPLFPIVESIFFFYGPVGDRHQLSIDIDFYIEGCFFSGMVHTWERPPGITFFKLGNGDKSGFPLIGIFAAVKAGHFIIDRSLAQKYKLLPGDSFILSGFEFHIAGISAGAAAYFTPFGFVLFDDLIDFYFESDLAEDISTFPLLSFLLVDLEKGEIPATVASRIEEAVPAADVFIPQKLAEHDMDLGRITLGPIFGMMISVAYVIGALVTAIIMFATINGRRQSIGVLKAVGFPNGYLLRLVLLEALILVVLALPAGIVVAKGIAAIIEFTAPLYLILATEGAPLVRTTLACGLFAVIGAVLPFRMIYNLEPNQVFRS